MVFEQISSNWMISPEDQGLTNKIQVKPNRGEIPVDFHLKGGDRPTSLVSKMGLERWCFSF